MHDTTTRRRLLQTAPLAALAAGLLATAGAPAAPAPAADPQTLATVVHADDLAEECRRLHAQMLLAAHAETSLEDPIEAALGYDAMNAWSSAAVTAGVTRETWIVAELARHLPGLAPTIRMLANHIETAAYAAPGACCTVATGFEP